MADSTGGSTSSSASSPDRRNFLKIGAGVVGGLVIGAGVGYLAKGSSTTTTTENMTETSTENMTETSTSTVTGPTTTATVTGPTTTATVTSTSVSTAPASTVTQTSTVTSTSTSVNTSQVAAQQAELVAYSGNSDALITIGVTEAACITALANTIIPADSNGPGATEAGVIYFIDRQLNGEYGFNGKMYRTGPFVPSGVAGPITINSSVGPITYSGGTFTASWFGNYKMQYNMTFRDFWRYGIDALEAYANTTYGGNYETLSAANQVACLSDLFNNKPSTASFNYIVPSDFANEVFFMVWSGFLMDPMYGGNRGMVGWVLTASPGLNSGNFYGEGQTPQQRMLSAVPQKLAPASMAQFQQSLKVAGVLSP